MPVGNRAVVTGGSRGIGAAAAVRLAEDGFDVAFCYRNSSAAAEQTAKEVVSRGVRCFHAPCDVSDEAAVTDFLAAVTRAIGRPEVLVNAAGIVRDNPVVLLSAADWAAVLDTNLTGTFHFCRALAFDFMKRRGGVIVNLSSVAGLAGNATQANYSAAKAGINGMSLALAKELAPYGIRVNVVAPGFIETDMTAGLPDKARAGALERIPLKRFGQAGEVADLISFLVSDRASYITGQVLRVDGGMVL